MLIKYLILALRPKHWIKNLFIFLPLIFGEKLFVFPVNLKVLIAFFLFSIVAGVVYLINDILDIEKDKLHPIKHLRPIASGKISVKQAQVTAFILGILSIIFSFVLDIYFGWVVVFYLIFNLIYTKILKEIVIIDVFCIAGFFLLRIIAGGIIAQVEISNWLIFMVVLLALFLGFNKRRQELKLFKENTNFQRPVLSQYKTYFIDLIIVVLTSAIVVGYMLYTLDARTVGYVGSNHLIYSIPFVYYGIFRYLYLIHKFKKDGDPTQILFSDKYLQIDILLWMIVCIAVIYLKF